MKRQQFPLFQSHLDLAHHYWKMILQKGGWAIDATCGNGNDTLMLAQIAQGEVIGIDIQQKAIQSTRTLLASSLPTEAIERIHLFEQSHAVFPSLAYAHPIRLIVYNLGYLPRGDKQVTTMTETTLVSLAEALKIIAPGGAISITCYPGHAEGAQEEKALLQKVADLPPAEWNVSYTTFLNRKSSPSLLLIQKQIR